MTPEEREQLRIFSEQILREHDPVRLIHLLEDVIRLIDRIQARQAEDGLASFSLTE